MTDYKKLGMPLPNEITADDMPKLLAYINAINQECLVAGHQQLGALFFGPPSCGKTPTIFSLPDTEYFKGYSVIFKKAQDYGDDVLAPMPVMATHPKTGANGYTPQPMFDIEMETRPPKSILAFDEISRSDRAQAIIERTLDDRENRSLVVFLDNGKFDTGTSRLAQNFITRCATFVVWDNDASAWERDRVDPIFFDMRRKIGRPDGYYACQRPLATALQKRACFWATTAFKLAESNKEFSVYFETLLAGIFEDSTRETVSIRFELKRMNLPSLNELAEGDARTANDPQSMQAHIDMLIDTATCEFDWKVIVDYSRRQPFAELRKALEERAIKAGYSSAV